MAIKNKIKSALIYPVAVLVVAFVVVAIIMIFVIPAFKRTCSRPSAPTCRRRRWRDRDVRSSSSSGGT